MPNRDHQHAFHKSAKERALGPWGAMRGGKNLAMLLADPQTLGRLDAIMDQRGVSVGE